MKGATTGTSTDAAGKFTLRTNAGATIEFTSIGFAKQSRTLAHLIQSALF
ncbi:hypothetical protein [Pedobacter jamesrossensis]